MQVEQRSYDNYTEDALSIRADSSREVNLFPSVKVSLDNIIVKEGYTSHNMVTRMISTDGANFIGELYEVDVKGETKEGNKETNIFVKHIIPGQAIKDLVTVKKSYMNEVFFYNELGKIFNTLQEIAHIPEEEKFKLVKSYDESSTDAILLDNLTRKGFKTVNRMEVMPLNFAELSIKQLARFHGLSFVLQQNRRQYFEKKIKTMKTPLQYGESWRTFARRMIDYSVKYFDSRVQDRINKFKDVLCEKQPIYIKGDKSSNRCLCHGDFKMSNIMMKEDNKDRSKVVIIDYQLIYYGSPVTDLMYLIYTSTDRQFREAHGENLKNLYHDTLTSFLKYFDLDIENFYPKKVFEKEFQDSLDYGLMVGLFILPFCFAVEDEVPDFSKDTLEDMTFKLDDRFRDRITEIVEEFLDLGIL